MATPKQTAANRRNAQKSTGPKTVQGKQNSSKNAVKHGILALLPPETEGWQDLLTSLYESLRPQDDLQRFLVDQIALCMIRLQRSAAWEAQTLARPAYIPLPPGRQYEMEEPPQVPASVRVPAFVASEGGQALLRYESACNRQIKRNLELLMTLKAAAHRLQQAPCPFPVEMEGAAPSAPPMPSCPEDTRRDATEPCVSHTRQHGTDAPQPGSPGLPAFQPGPSGPGYAPGNINDWHTEYSLGLAPSPLEGEGRDEGRQGGLFTVGETELASFRKHNGGEDVGAELVSALRESS